MRQNELLDFMQADLQLYNLIFFIFEIIGIFETKRVNLNILSEDFHAVTEISRLSDSIQTFTWWSCGNSSEIVFFSFHEASY